MPTTTETCNPLLRFLWSLFRPRRFFAVSLAMGGVVWLATAGSHPMFRILAASDTFFFAFVLYAVLLAFRMQPDQLRRRQHGEHVARLAMVFVSFCAVILSLVAIFTLLNHPRSEGNLFPIFAVSSVPLTWAMLHIMAASHYTHLYYSESRTGVPEGGLIFPGGTVPSGTDFLYYAVVIGTSASVSDVVVASRDLRIATMVHSLLSFAFNTVLIAIAVNAAMTLT